MQELNTTQFDVAREIEEDDTENNKVEVEAIELKLNSRTYRSLSRNALTKPSCPSNFTTTPPVQTPSVRHRNIIDQATPYKDSHDQLVAMKTKVLVSSTAKAMSELMSELVCGMETVPSKVNSSRDTCLTSPKLRRAVGAEVDLRW